MIDLGAAPASNAFNASQDALEEHYPLRVWVCMACGLAQTDITMFKLDHDALFHPRLSVLLKHVCSMG